MQDDKNPMVWDISQEPNDIPVDHEYAAKFIANYDRYVRASRNAAEPATLAAAPTIPATGEAIPEGMKPWHGGNGPPNDWDGGEVLLENEQMGDGNVWDHHPSRSPSRIVAYTPKASIPATGHAATEGNT